MTQIDHKGVNTPLNRAEIIEQYQKRSAELNALMWEKSNEIDTIIAKIENAKEAQTPETHQNNEQINNPNKWEELAKYRVIGDETRKMLIAQGKISDAVSIISEVFNYEYGKDSEEMLQPFYDAINNSQKKLLDLMCIIIDNNINCSCCMII